MKRVEITQEQRTWVLERDNYTCQNCLQVRGNLHIHHIVAFSYAYFLGWSMKRINNPTNLITICRICHNLLHNQDRWDMQIENRLAEIAIENTLQWKRRN